MRPLIILLLILVTAPAQAGVLEWAIKPLGEMKHMADAHYEAGEFKKAYKNYFQLASLGNKFAQYRLSVMYLEGRGVTTNLPKAYAWSKVASEYGQAELQNHSAGILRQIPISDKARAEKLAEKYWNRYNNLSVLETIYIKARQEKLKSIGRGLLPESHVSASEPCDDPGIAQGGGASGAGDFSSSAGIGPCGGMSPMLDTTSAAERLARIRSIERVLGDMIEGGYVKLGDFEVIDEDIDDEKESEEEADAK